MNEEKKEIPFIKATEEDWASVRISPCVYTVRLKCLICEDIIDKEYVGGSDIIPPKVYICESCKSAIKQLKDRM